MTGTCAGTAQGQRQTSRKITSLRCRLQESALSCRGFVRRASQELHLPSNLGTRQRLDLPDTDPRFTARRSAISGCEDLLGAEISRPAPRTRASGLTTEQGLFKSEGPANGAFQCTKVLRARQSSGRGGQQLPVLGQNDCIDGVNDAVRRNDVRLGDTGPIDPNVP